jgi:hypothetical protein
MIGRRSLPHWVIQNAVAACKTVSDKLVCD